MKLVVGLGNPGREYSGTRHNVGFDTIDILAKRARIYVKSRRNKALVGEGWLAGEHVTLIKPLTFMNLSGEAVAGLARRYRVDSSDIIVISDDTNLPLGKLRVRASGSSGGHKGLRSIIHSLGTEEFPRIRVGVGSPDRHMVDYVLSRFSRAERPSANAAISRAADALESILADGIDQAMNRFNAPAE